MSEGLVLSGRYRLVRQLGAGGMGSVWLAEDLNLGANVAVKLLDTAIAESPEAVVRFRQEAQSAAMIRSTHVVQILDHGVDQGRPYIAMELLEGENLGDRLERVRLLTPLDVARILGHVGRALSLAHARGIVHRDLKPDNIFLVSEGDEEIAKVVDFGVARRITGLTDSSVSKTRTGTMLGTPYYMSPEQATGQSVDQQSDIWALGVIACECLTGQRIFEGETIGALFHAICMLPIPKPSSLGPVPEGFDEWFARVVEREKSRRVATLKEAADSLRLICGLDIGRSSSASLSVSRLEIGRKTPSGPSGVSAVFTELKSTASPSSVTIGDRVRKRPVLASTLGMCLVSLVAIIGWRRASPDANRINQGTYAIRGIELSATPLPAAPRPSAMSVRGEVARTVESESSAVASATSTGRDAAPLVSTVMSHQRAFGTTPQGTLPPVSGHTVGTKNVKRLTNAAGASDPSAGHSPLKATTGAEQSGARKAAESRSIVGKSDNAAGI